MSEALLPPPSGADTIKTTPDGKPEAPTINEYAFYQVYPYSENKSDVLNSGFKDKDLVVRDLAVPFTPRGGDQGSKTGRQLAVGTDPDDPHKLIMPEDVRPYNGLKDDRRNKAPNEVDNVVVFERLGDKYTGYSLYEVTGGKNPEKVERGTEFNLGDQTLTVIGLDQKGDILLYKGKLKYYPEQPLPAGDLPEPSGKRLRFGTPPKIEFPGGFLKRKSAVTAETDSPKVSESTKPSSIKINDYGEIISEGSSGIEGGLGKGWWDEDYSSLMQRQLQESLTAESYRKIVEEMSRKKNLDPLTDKKVERMWKLKLPGFDKRVLRLLPLAALLLAAIATHRSTIPNIPFPGSGQGLGKGEGGSPSGPVLNVPMPEFVGPSQPPPLVFEDKYKADREASARRMAAERERIIQYSQSTPYTIKEFMAGMGWGKLEYKKADFPYRDDLQKKLAPGDPKANPYLLEGYSVHGLTEGQIIKALNPNVAKRADDLEAQQTYLPETDFEFNRTRDLLKKEIDEYYGEGTYNKMVAQFSERMRNVLEGRHMDLSNLAAGNVTLPASSFQSDKIIKADIDVWKIGDQDIDQYFKTLARDGGIKHDKNVEEWKNIKDRVIKEGSDTSKP